VLADAHPQRENGATKKSRGEKCFDTWTEWRFPRNKMAPTDIRMPGVNFRNPKANGKSIRYGAVSLPIRHIPVKALIQDPAVPRKEGDPPTLIEKI
jgi:hypothetical protein